MMAVSWSILAAGQEPAPGAYVQRSTSQPASQPAILSSRHLAVLLPLIGTRALDVVQALYIPDTPWSIWLFGRRGMLLVKLDASCKPCTPSTNVECNLLGARPLLPSRTCFSVVKTFLERHTNQVNFPMTCAVCIQQVFGTTVPQRWKGGGRRAVSVHAAHRALHAARGGGI